MKAELKKRFESSVEVDFSKLRFYQIPFRFFAEWLNLVLEISKVIEPSFQVNIPKKQLDWYTSDSEVFDTENGTSFILRSSSAILKDGAHSIQVIAQYGYDSIPGQYIVVKSSVSGGRVFSRSMMKDRMIDFEISADEKQLGAVEEVFYLFE